MRKCVLQDWWTNLFYSLEKTSRRFILHVEAYFSARRSILFQLFY
jgi:hypothetical protein